MHEGRLLFDDVQSLGWVNLETGAEEVLLQLPSHEIRAAHPWGDSAIVEVKEKDGIGWYVAEPDGGAKRLGMSYDGMGGAVSSIDCDEACWYERRHDEGPAHTLVRARPNQPVRRMVLPGAVGQLSVFNGQPYASTEGRGTGPSGYGAFTLNRIRHNGALEPVSAPMRRVRELIAGERFAFAITEGKKGSPAHQVVRVDLASGEVVTLAEASFGGLERLHRAGNTLYWMETTLAWLHKPKKHAPNTVVHHCALDRD